MPFGTTSDDVSSCVNLIGAPRVLSLAASVTSSGDVSIEKLLWIVSVAPAGAFTSSTECSLPSAAAASSRMNPARELEPGYAPVPKYWSITNEYGGWKCPAPGWL